MKKINKQYINIDKLFEPIPDDYIDSPLDLLDGTEMTDLRVARYITSGYLKGPVEDIIGLGINIDFDNNLHNYCYFMEPTIFDNRTEIKDFYRRLGVVYTDDIKVINI
jgi:hypothetical protein